MRLPPRLLVLAVVMAVPGSQAQIGDNFNIPNTSTIPGWTEAVGDWQITNQELHAQASASWQYITYDASAGTGDFTLTSSIYYQGGPRVVFIGHLHRYRGTGDCILIKMQDNSSSGNFNRCFLYDQGIGMVGYYDVIAPFTSAVVQTEVTGNQVTLRIDNNMDCTWDETTTWTTGISGTGLLGVCGYNNGVLDDFNLACSGPPASLEVDVVDTAPTTVMQGQTGILVTMSVSNPGGVDADNLTGTLTFTGVADRTAEYTVTPDPGNPTTIGPGGLETLQFTVDVSPAATMETITLDGSADAIDSLGGGPINDTGANTTDSWDVVRWCVAPVCGDCSGDNVVDILDALLAAQHAALLVTLTGPQLDACDVDSSLAVDILDGLMIAQYSALLPITLSCCA